jgi:hypothetical protein
VWAFGRGRVVKPLKWKAERRLYHTGLDIQVANPQEGMAWSCATNLYMVSTLESLPFFFFKD